MVTLGECLGFTMKHDMWFYSDTTDVSVHMVQSSIVVHTGDPPFAKLSATELLQHLQRGKHLKQPPTCSHAL